MNDPMRFGWFCVLLLLGGCVGAFERAPFCDIEPAASLPDTSPWELESLSKAPDFEWGERGDVCSLYFKSEAYQGAETRVFAYYASPATLTGTSAEPGQYPGIVLVHGGGGRAFSKWARLWASRGFAAIAIDLSGRGPGRKKLSDGGPDMTDAVIFYSMDEPVQDQWTYHSVANVIRAHSLLRSFPEVDAERTAVTGISWGGYLTCIVAGLDSRFKAAVPVYGCGFLAENSAWLHAFEKMGPKNRERWVQLWDPSMYVGSATMPMLFVNGGKDFAYWPDSHAKTYALVKSPKNLHFVTYLKHGHTFDRPKAIESFIRHHLEGGVQLPKIGEVDIRDGEITASVDTTTKLTKAALHFTQDSLNGKPSEREWSTRPALLAENTIRADLPPKDATAWFLTVEDERALTVSSSLVFPGQD